jgi:hypothetical protein
MIKYGQCEACQKYSKEAKHADIFLSINVFDAIFGNDITQTINESGRYYQQITPVGWHG